MDFRSQFTMSEEEEEEEEAVVQLRLSVPPPPLNTCPTLWTRLRSLQAAVLHELKREGHVVDLQR